MPVEVTENPAVVDVQTKDAGTIVEAVTSPTFVEVAAVGVQGRPGAQGPPGISPPAEAFRLVVDHPTPLLVWDVGHDLNGYPSVTVVDSTNRIVVGEVEYLGPMAVRLTFSAAFAGKVFFS